jgi:hypothetical protein
MGVTSSENLEHHHPLSPIEELSLEAQGDHRFQPWKPLWPPTQAVKPATEKSLRGRQTVLHAGGGAYPNYIKPTEGVRL